jgi:hypothetical protein
MRVNLEFLKTVKIKNKYCYFYCIEDIGENNAAIDLSLNLNLAKSFITRT